MVQALWFKIDAGTAIQPGTHHSIGALLWSLVFFPPRDPFDAANLHDPAEVAPQGQSAPVGIATLLRVAREGVRGGLVFLEPANAQRRRLDV